MDIRRDAEPISTDDFWYDFLEAGYIEPDDFLEMDDAGKVKEAMMVIINFRDTLEGNDLIEEM